MLRRYALVCSLCVSVLLASQASGPATAQGVPTDPTTLPLLQFSDIAYRGGFRLPAGSANGDTFEIGGGAVAYNPGANSLFVASRRGNVAEVSIPASVDSTVVTDLPFASYLQSFADPTEGNLSQIASNDVAIDSLLVAGGRLYGTGSIYYDALNSQRVSHYSRSLTLSEPSFRGMYSVGDPAKTGFVSGYMATVPPEWQALLGGPAITGQCCIPIVTRTSWGPGAFAWNPADLGTVSPAPVKPLLYYTGDHATLGHWSGADAIYGATTQMGGVTIVAGTRTALFLGRNGLGPFCYGNGTSNMSLAGTHGADGELYCYDPTSDDKGQHAYPYTYQIWAYDLNDFAAVKAGLKQPWEIVPYGVWPFSLPTLEPAAQIGGVGYDAARQIVYISQLRADQDGYAYRPLIHALKVTPPGTSSGETVTTSTTSAQVTSVALTSNKTAPQASGTTISWTAAPAGGIAPYQYKWLVFTNAWTVVNSWTTSNSFAWTPTSASPDAKVSVWVRSATNTANVAELSQDVPFPIVTASAPTTPVDPLPSSSGAASSVALTANMSAPQTAGTTITWSAAPAGGAAPYQYKWLLYTDAWTVVSNWSTASTFAWTPPSANPDAKVSVWVRSASNTADVPETSRDVPFPIVPVPLPARVTAVALTANMGIPQPAGTTIPWSAQPTGGVAPYQYKWLVYRDAWTAVTGWTTANTFAWTPTAADPNAKVSVWVRSAGNTADEPEASRDVPFPIVVAPVPAKAQMTSPTPSSTLTSSTVTFEWTGGTLVSEYWLEVGSTAHLQQFYSRPLTSLSTTISSLPTDGSTVHVRLWSRLSGAWQHNDYFYAAALKTKAQMITPGPSSTLTASTVTFQWAGGTGVSEYWLEVGSPAHLQQFYSQPLTSLSATISSLPTDGSTVHVRLWSRLNGGWQHNDYFYAAARKAKAQMIWPGPSSTLTSSTVTFQWTGGTDVSEYWLEVGSAAHLQRFYSQPLTSQSATVSALPTDGSTVIVRLWSRLSEAWQHTDYTYTSR